VLGTNENNDNNMNMVWQKQNSQSRPPAQMDVWPQEHSQQHSAKGGELWDPSTQVWAGGRRAESPGVGFQPSESVGSSAR